VVGYVSFVCLQNNTRSSQVQVRKKRLHCFFLLLSHSFGCIEKNKANEKKKLEKKRTNH